MGMPNPHCTWYGGTVSCVAMLNMEKGMRKSQVGACLATHIQNLVFDTTAVSNAGLHCRACMMIKEGLGRNLC